MTIYDSRLRDSFDHIFGNNPSILTHGPIFFNNEAVRGLWEHGWGEDRWAYLKSRYFKHQMKNLEPMTAIVYQHSIRKMDVDYLNDIVKVEWKVKLDD